MQQPGLRDESSSYKVQLQLSDSLLQLPSDERLTGGVIEQLEGLQQQAGPDEELERLCEQSDSLLQLRSVHDDKMTVRVIEQLAGMQSQVGETEEQQLLSSELVGMTVNVIEQHEAISQTRIGIEQLVGVIPQPGPAGEQVGPSEQQLASSGLVRQTETVMEGLQQPELSKVKLELSDNLLQFPSEIKRLVPRFRNAYDEFASVSDIEVMRLKSGTVPTHKTEPLEVVGEIADILDDVLDEVAAFIDLMKIVEMETNQSVEETIYIEKGYMMGTTTPT